jgi:peptide/nickel transport system substrate-binding protein
MKYRLYILLIILSVLFVSIATACSIGAKKPSTLVYGLTLSPSGIDPHLNASSELGIPLASVYDTLVFRDPAIGEFVPGLSERWSISPDGLKYTFTLRRDVTFHDGTPFNAHAVVANLDYVMDPDHHSQKARFMLGPLQDVEIIDDYTVALHLAEPFAPLLDSLSDVYLGMASPTALETWGPTEYQFHQVGTGPYRFDEYIPNDKITLTRNPDYAWAPSIYRNSKAKIETIVFQFYEDPSTRAIALESGEVDIIGEVPPNDANRFAISSDFNLYPIPISGQPMQFFFNTTRAPTDDARVRLALIYAVNRPQAVKTIFDVYSPVAQSPFLASSFDLEPRESFPAYDPDTASALLDEAGWRLTGDDNVRSLNSVPFKLHIVAPPWGSNPDMAQLIQADWEAIGARVTLEIAPGFGPLKEAQTNGDYHAIGINFFGTDPDLLRSFYTSTGLYNWSGFEDLEIDRLLNQAARIPLDLDARLQLYEQFSSRVREEALVLPIRNYVNLVVVNNQVEGLHFSAQGWYPILIDLQMAP